MAKLIALASTTKCPPLACQNSGYQDQTTCECVCKKIFTFKIFRDNLNENKYFKVLLAILELFVKIYLIISIYRMRILPIYQMRSQHL